MSLQLSAPQPLTADHLLNEFACGETSLDEWLKRRALANQTSGASGTFVVVDPERRIYGYYAMAADAVLHQLATSGVRRKRPDHVSVMVLARLAVDGRALDIQLGAALRRVAVQRAVAASQNACVRALLVSALHERARQFYLHYGIQESPQHPMTLMLRLNTVSGSAKRRSQATAANGLPSSRSSTALRHGSGWRTWIGSNATSMYTALCRTSTMTTSTLVDAGKRLCKKEQFR